MLEKEFGIKMTYVPFDGGGDVAKNLVGGHIDSSVNNPSEAMGFYKAGKCAPSPPLPQTGSTPSPTPRPWANWATSCLLDAAVLCGARRAWPGEAVAYYTEMFEQLSALPKNGRHYTADEALMADFLTGDDLQAYFLEERDKHAELLDAMGEGS